MPTVSKAKIERAEMYFAIYLSLGASRSLRRVYEVCSDLDDQWQKLAPQLGMNPKVSIAVSLSALNNYSQTFRWTDRIRNLPHANQQVQQRGLELAMQAAERQRQAGQALQQVGNTGIRAKMQDPDGRPRKIEPGEFTLTEIARALDVGSRMESRALEQAHQHVNSADTAALFLYENLPRAIVKILDFLRLEGDARALAVGVVAEEVDALILQLYGQFKVQPPDYLVPEEDRPEPPEPIMLPGRTG
jgi:hypothetical protein